jgi:hypothetical protein
MSTDEKSAHPRLSIPPVSLIPLVGQPQDAANLRESTVQLVPLVTSPTGVTVDRIDSARTIHARVTVPVQSPEKHQRFKLPRDKDRPLEFDGIELAKVAERSQSTKTVGATMVTRAALYRTRAGKFVTEFTRFEAEPLYPNPNAPRPVDFAKVAVFDSQGVAMKWFRVGGRFTLKLWEQLGGQESEFIE